MGWATFWAIFFTNPSGLPDSKVSKLIETPLNVIGQSR
jgi:hypothetical protein